MKGNLSPPALRKTGPAKAGAAHFALLPVQDGRGVGMGTQWLQQSTGQEGGLLSMVPVHTASLPTSPVLMAPETDGSL